MSRKYRSRRQLLNRLVSWRKRRITKLRKRFGVVRLDMPFVSQLPINDQGEAVPGAEKYYNDCGPACDCMIIEAIYPNTKVDPNHVFELIQKKDMFTSIWENQNVLEKNFGIPNTREAGLSLPGLIDAGLGIIALILYSQIQDWEANKYSGFLGQHFVVVEGYKKNKEGEVTHIFIHDPLKPAGLLYRPRKIQREVFDEAWRKAAPIRTAIVTVGKAKND